MNDRESRVLPNSSRAATLPSLIPATLFLHFPKKSRARSGRAAGTTPSPPAYPERTMSGHHCGLRSTGASTILRPPARSRGAATDRRMAPARPLQLTATTSWSSKEARRRRGNSSVTTMPAEKGGKSKSPEGGSPLARLRPDTPPRQPGEPVHSKDSRPGSGRAPPPISTMKGWIVQQVRCRQDVEGGRQLPH